MIDIDLLDERLVDALDDELRLIRRGDAERRVQAPQAVPRAPVGPTGPVAPVTPVAPTRPERPKAALKLAKPAKPPKVPKPAPVAPARPVTAPAGDTDSVVDLLRQGRLAEADHQIARQSATALETRDAHRRHDAATWDAMRALLDGDHAKARASVDSARALGVEAHGADTMDRYWTQRFWIGFEWGDEDEQLELLDHCRERAYRYDDLEWRGPLALALARLGRTEEALREFDVTYDQVRSSRRVDLLSMLAEAAFLLGDAERSARVERHLEREPKLVVIGPGWVCMGSLARYQAHAAAGMGAWEVSDQLFQTAVKVHRELMAEPLLARTLREWGSSLIGRNDTLAHLTLRDSDEIATRLSLTGLAMPIRQPYAA